MAILNRNIITADLFTPRKRLPDGSVQWQIAPIVHWGPHGIGKTEMGEALGRELGFDYIHTIIPSNCDPGDIGGVPMLVEGQGYFRRTPPEWAFRANEAERALIVIDECGDAERSIQAPLQQVINERRVGDLHLNGNVRFLLFGNPVGISTNGYEWSMPMANRAGHVDIVYGEEELDAWRAWTLAGGGMQSPAKPMDAAALEARVIAEYGPAYAQAAAMASGFVGAVRRLLVLPDKSSAEASRAHATPRTMTMATAAMTAGILHNLDESDRDELVEMFIGEAMATTFADWRSKNELPPLEDVLDGKLKWKPDSARPDLSMAVFDGGSALVTQGTKDKNLAKARAEKLWELIWPVCKDEPDVVWMASQNLSTGGFRRIGKARQVMGELRETYNILSDMDGAA